MRVPALRSPDPNLFHQEKIHHWKQIYVNNLFIYPHNLHPGYPFFALWSGSYSFSVFFDMFF